MLPLSKAPTVTLSCLRRPCKGCVVRRYIAGVKRREDALMRDIATAAAALYPNGMRQERVLNWVPFLARYGPAFVESMRGEATRHAAALIGMSATDRASAVVERV